MPTPPSDRQMVCVRLAKSGIQAIDRLATAEGVDRSAMIRVLLAEAVSARLRKAAR